MDQLWTLRRSVTQAKVAGVCATLADHWRIDPLVVRLATAVAALSAGIGVVLYAAAWLLLPRADAERPILEDWIPSSATWPPRNIVIGVFVAVIAVLVTMGSVFPLSSLPFLVLVAAWYFGHHRPRRQEHGQHPVPRSLTPGAPQQVPFPAYRHSAEPDSALPQTRPGPGAPAMTAPPVAPGPVRQVPVAANPAHSATPPAAPSAAGTPPSSHLAAPAWAPSSPPRTDWEPTRVDLLSDDPELRATLDHAPLDDTTLDDVPLDDRDLLRPADNPRTSGRGSHRGSARVLQRATLLGMFLVLLGLVIANQVGVPVPSKAWVAGPAVVAAVGLLLSAWLGRGRALMPVAVISALVAILAVIPSYLGDSSRFGNVEFTPTTMAELPDEIESDVGNIVLDLGDLDVTDDQEVEVATKVGDVTLRLPADANVIVLAETEVGTLRNEVTGEHTDGVGQQEARWEFRTRDPEAATLTIEVSTDVGDVEVDR